MIDEVASKVDGFSYEQATGAAAPERSLNFALGFQGTKRYRGNQGAPRPANFSMLRTAATTASPSSPSIRATGAPGLLENVPTGGKKPRNFEIAPGGAYLIAANQPITS